MTGVLHTATLHRGPGSPGSRPIPSRRAVRARSRRHRRSRPGLTVHSHTRPARARRLRRLRPFESMRALNGALLETNRRGIGIEMALLTKGQEPTNRFVSRQLLGNIGNRPGRKELAKVAESGKLALLGRKSRRFKSCHPDQSGSQNQFGRTEPTSGSQTPMSGSTETRADWTASPAISYVRCSPSVSVSVSIPASIGRNTSVK